MRRPLLSGLRTRLLALVLLALLPMLALTLYAALSERSAAAEKAERSALRLASAVVANQEQLISDARQLLATLVEAPDLRAEDPVVCNVYLADVLTRWPQYANLGVVEPNGAVRCSAAPTTGRVDLRDRLEFQRAVGMRDFAVGAYEIDPITRRASLDFAHPVLDARGRVTSVVFAALDLTWLNRLAAGAQLTPGTTLTVIDEKGEILARYPNPERWVGRVSPEEALVEKVLDRRQGVAEADGLDGVERFYGFTPLPGASGRATAYVSAGIPKARVLAGPNRELRRDLLVLGLIGALALAAAWAGGHAFLLRPMGALAAAARRLSAGDLGARTGLREQRGELAQLGRTFDEMAASLERREDELHRLNEELEERVLDRTAELAAANESLESRNVELETLHGFGEELASETELGVLGSTILDRLADFAAAEVATLYTLESDEGETLSLMQTRGLDAEALAAEVHPGEGLAGRATAERRLLQASYGETGLRISAFGEEFAIHCELHVPLVHGDRALGVVTLGRLGDRPFAPAELEILRHLANQAAVALSNALAFKSVRRQASINRAVLDATVEGISLVDREGNSLIANAAMDRLDGRALADETTDAGAYRATLEAMAADPDWVGSDEYELTDSGRSFHRYTAPVRDSEGEFIGRLITVRETTAEREAERLRAELVATVENELRRPLASILGFAELLVSRRIDAATRKRYLETIHGEARRLTELANDFLDLQRLEEGEVALALEPLDLSELLAGQVELFARENPSHELALVLPSKRIVALAERDQIMRAVGCLLASTLRYIPDGGAVEIRVEEARGAARLSVSADFGMPAEQQRDIFGRFFERDASGSRPVGGTGLGLALARRIVEAHGGRAGFASAGDERSTLWIEIPRESPLRPS